jgi:coenzyme F420-0:L-glutamate ligase/coenzyme F420-1:gamma-L-glutamate ligase
LSQIKIIPVNDFPLIYESDRGASYIVDLLCDLAKVIDGDIIVIAQKIISKIEGRSVKISDVKPSETALQLAKEVNKDPRLVELILSESIRIVRSAPGVLIVETHHGFICANAGVDRSNVFGEDVFLKLPENPDRSAMEIRVRIKNLYGLEVGVIISDSFNRPWRKGSVNVALGVSGINPLLDLRGTKDDVGKTMESSMVAIVDEIASAAQLVMGESGGIPVAIVRGMRVEASDVGWQVLKRSYSEDLFR